MILVFYISGHGFGHATRDLEVIHHILIATAGHADRRPQSRPAVVPRAVGSRGDSNVQPCETDTGIMQIDSLRSTRRKRSGRRAPSTADFGTRAAVEAEVLRASRTGASVSSATSRRWRLRPRRAPGIARSRSRISRGTGSTRTTPRSASSARASFDDHSAGVSPATLALRLPFAGGFETHARRIRRRAAAWPVIRGSDARGLGRLLDLSTERPVVLGSFGGHGAACDFARSREDNDVTLIVTDHEMRSPPDTVRRALRCFDRNARPGSTSATKTSSRQPTSSSANRATASCPSASPTAPPCSTPRAASSPRHDVFVSGMHTVLRCRFIDQETCANGRWQEQHSRVCSNSRLRETHRLPTVPPSPRARFSTLPHFRAISRVRPSRTCRELHRGGHGRKTEAHGSNKVP